jgi:hypothetical protein
VGGQRQQRKNAGTGQATRFYPEQYRLTGGQMAVVETFFEFSGVGDLWENA